MGPTMAMYEDCDGDDYRTRIRDHYEAEFPMIPSEPCCARTRVEQAAVVQGLARLRAV
jgi:hypothetical protein